MKLTEDFRTRFEKALAYADMKAVDLARATGISEATISQYRSGYSTPNVIACLTPTNGKIVDLTPQGLTKRFETLIRRCELHPFRFHDLRAYSISARHAMGIPDQYTIGTSGHSTDSVLKRVYRREMSDRKKEFDRIANGYFSDLFGNV